MKAAVISACAVIGVSIFLNNWSLIALILLLLLMAFVSHKQQQRKKK
jgi:hypothetical protein